MQTTLATPREFVNTASAVFCINQSIKYSAPGLGKEETNRREVSAAVYMCFLQIRVPKVGVQCQSPTQKVPAATKMEPKGKPKWAKEPSRNIQRHPCGTGSTKCRKRMPKDANLGAHCAHCWIEIIKHFKKKIIHQSREKDKLCQSDAKRDPQIIDVWICLWNNDFRKMLVLQW